MAREVRIYIAFLLPITCARPSAPYIRRLSLLLPPLVRVSSILNFKSHLSSYLIQDFLFFLILPIFHRFQQYVSTIIQIYPYFIYPCQICSVGQLYAFASRTHAYTRIDCGKCRVFAIENTAYHLLFCYVYPFVPTSVHVHVYIFFFSFPFFRFYIFLYFRSSSFPLSCIYFFETFERLT